VVHRMGGSEVTRIVGGAPWTREAIRRFRHQNPAAFDEAAARIPAMTPEQEAVYASLERENAYFRAHEDEPWTEGELREAWGS